MGTDVIFNCSSNKPAIWTKLIPDGDSARVGYIAIGRKLFDEELAEKFRLGQLALESQVELPTAVGESA